MAELGQENRDPSGKCGFEGLKSCRIEGLEDDSLAVPTEPSREAASHPGNRFIERLPLPVLE